MVSEPLPKIDRFGTPHASVNYPEELDDNASLTIRSVGLVIHVAYVVWICYISALPAELSLSAAAGGARRRMLRANTNSVAE